MLYYVCLLCVDCLFMKIRTRNRPPFFRLRQSVTLPTMAADKGSRQGQPTRAVRSALWTGIYDGSDGHAETSYPANCAASVSSACYENTRFGRRPDQRFVYQ
jgi:hypothetical protein